MKTTRRHFELFKKECLRLQVVLGLNGWTIAFEHVKLEGLNSKIVTSCLTKQATIALSSDHSDVESLTDLVILRHAKHEMAHLLLADLDDLARQRYVQEGELDEAEHRIVRTLEKIL